MNKKIVVIRSKALLPSEKLFSLEEKLRHDYETGFIFVPCYCDVFIADEVDMRENFTIVKGSRYESEPHATPQGKTNAEIFKQTFGIYATELWSMKEADFLEWLNAEVRGVE